MEATYQSGELDLSQLNRLTAELGQRKQYSQKSNSGRENWIHQEFFSQKDCRMQSAHLQPLRMEGFILASREPAQCEARRT